MCKDTVTMIEYVYDEESDGGNFVEKEGHMNVLSISRSNVNIVYGDSISFYLENPGKVHFLIKWNKKYFLVASFYV